MEQVDSERRRPWLVLGGCLVLAVLLVGGAWLLNRLARGDTRNLLTAEQPALVRSFQITDKAGMVLWRVSSGQARYLREIRYGKVPESFEQEVPTSGTRPRPFRDHEVLVTKTVLAKGTFEHRGVALGSDRFLGGAWSAVDSSR